MCYRVVSNGYCKQNRSLPLHRLLAKATLQSAVANVDQKIKGAK